MPKAIWYHNYKFTIRRGLLHTSAVVARHDSKRVNKPAPSSDRPAGEASNLPTGPLGEVLGTFTRRPDGRIIREVP